MRVKLSVLLNYTSMLICFNFMKNHFATSTPPRIDVDSTSILRRCVEDQISTNLHVIFTYFFDVVSLIEKSTLFPRTSFNVISLVEKFTLFPLTFLDVILMVKKYTLLARTFFDEISMGKNSMSFVVKMQVNENIRGGLPLLVTLKS